MRILMMAQFYPPIIGGEEQHVRNLSLALAKRGHSVTVATTWQRGLPHFEVDGPVKVHRLLGSMQRAGMLFSEPARRYAPPFPDPELLFHLSRIVSQERPEIVHAHNWLVHSFLPLKRATGPRLAVSLHDISLVCAQKNAMRGGLPCSGPGIWKCLHCASRHYGTIKGGVTTLANWCFGTLERRAVDIFLPVSRAIAIANGLADAQLPFEIIPNFVADAAETARSEESPLTELLPAENYLLYVGDLRHFKGVHVLLAAYRMLKDAPPLVLIGRRCDDTPTELPPKVSLFESWPHDAVMHAWSKCLFGIVPSILPEACPSVVIEAMTAGKPVIASNAGGIPDLVDHGITGLLVPPRNTHVLLDAMRILIENPDLRARLAAAAKHKAEKFKASSIVPRIEEIYASIMTKHDRQSWTQPTHH